MKLFTYRINRVAVRMAGAFFALGNLICMLYLFSDVEVVIVLGISFLVIYIGSSIIMSLILLMNLLIHFKHIKEHITAMILFYLNVPIALLYANLIF